MTSTLIPAPVRPPTVAIDDHGRRRSRPAGMSSNPWVRAVRPHQWIKAALVLLAPMVAFNVSIAVVECAAAAVVLACVAASGTYLLNDASDAPADRLHPSKRTRPIAAGEITRPHAVAVGLGLLVAAPALGVLLGVSTGLALGGYVVLTVAYSTALKRVPVVDVLAIAAGFVLRVEIGGLATGTPVAPWFLFAVGSGAVMVATGKRRGELHELGAGAPAHRRSLATYRNSLTATMLLAAAAAQCVGMAGWAIIGSGGPHLDESWALALLVPVMVGLGHYLHLALTGLASKPERLVGDRLLQASAVGALIVFLLGRAS